MRKTGLLAALGLLAATVLTACGGGSTGSFQTPGTTGNTPGTTVAGVTLNTSSPSLQSDGSKAVTISAYVRNANNQFMSGVAVVFSTTAGGGGLGVVQGTTDTNGLATATLLPLNPSLRTITVQATAGTISSTVDIVVVGTAINFVSGPTSLNLSQTGTYIVQLTDAGKNPIANQALAIASSAGNTLNPASVVTDSTGSATFKMTATKTVNDTLTVTGLGATQGQGVTVNANSLSFTTPAAGTAIPLNTNQTVTVQYLVAAAPVAGQTVTFSTTRGTVAPASATTDASGNASAVVSAVNAGGAVVTATVGSGATATSTGLSLAFIATVAASIDVQANPFNIGPQGTSKITAVVRDAQNNLVQGAAVDFTLADITGGTISNGTGTTDSQGTATTTYTASSVTSASNGVKITATVHNTAVTGSASLSVGQRQVFISLGTGNKITAPNQAQYQIQYAVQITDSSGNGVSGIPVSVTILSTTYYKGFRFVPSGATHWSTQYTVSVGNATQPTAGLTGYPGCKDEDVNHNGVLDPGEDYNNSGKIEAGNIATVSPSAVTTDASGFALINVTYPAEYAYYVDVALSASGTVQGTEYVRTSNFSLPGLAADFADVNTVPPGSRSAFGTSNTCADTL